MALDTGIHASKTVLAEQSC